MSQAAFDSFSTPVDPTPETGPSAPDRKFTRGGRKRLRRVSKQDVSDSIRSLAMMLRVQRGEITPLLTLALQYEGSKLGVAYQEMAEQVAHGVPFAKALDAQEIFPPVVRRLALVGDRTGNPAPHLTKAADLVDESLETAGKVRAALLEPTILLVMVILFFVGMVTLAIPQMIGVFTQTGAKVPALTTFALQLSSVAQVVAPLLAVMVLGAWIWWRKSGRKSETLRARMDALSVSLPIVGPLRRDAALANALSVLGALADLALPERDALLTAASGCDNRALGALLRNHADALTAGSARYSDLADGRLVPLAVGSVLAAADSAGELPMGLKHVADTYRRSARLKADNLSTALGPAANIVVGVLFAGAVLVVYLPMYSMFTAVTAF